MDKEKRSIQVRIEEGYYQELKKASIMLTIPMSELIVSSLLDRAKDEYEQADRFLKQVEAGNITTEQFGELEPIIEMYKHRKKAFSGLYDKYMEKLEESYESKE